MNANCPGRFAIVEIAQYRVPQHEFQVFPVIALGEDAVTDGPGCVAPFRRFPHLEDYFCIRYFSPLLLSLFSILRHFLYPASARFSSSSSAASPSPNTS